MPRKLRMVAPAVSVAVGALYDFGDFTLYDRCITRGVSGITPVLYGNGAVSFALSADREWDRQVADAKAKGLPIPPRNMGMEVYSGAPTDGREPVREFGFGSR